MLYVGRLDNLTRERKIELEKKLQELKEPKLLDSFHIEINRLGYKESRYLIDEISIKEVLDFGDIAAQHKIFEKLDICEIINKYSTKGGGTIDVGRLAEIMAINRNCDPCSRRKLPLWFETTVLPILLNIKHSEINDKLFLRTFPYLQEKTTIPIQKEIYDKITQVYEIKTEKIYYDITSSYFEGKSCPLSKYGYKVEEKLQKTKSDIESGKHNLTDRRKKNISCMLKSQKVGKFIKLEFTDNGFTFERINETIEKSRKYEGVFLLSTTEIDLKGEEILKIYREKDIIEKAFRTIKSEIEMRPFFLSTEKSVIGYVFICALAYQIRSVLKFHMKKSNSEMSIEDAFEILNRYKVVKIAVEEKGVQVYRKVAIEGQKDIDVINCFDLESEFEKVSCLNSV